MTLTLLDIPDEVWGSLYRRKEREIRNEEAVEYLILEFVIKDVENNTNAIISKTMLDAKRKRFQELLEQRRKKNAT